MKVLDLFSGIGGFSLGLESAGMETVAFCEVNQFCRSVLNKHWPNVPIFDDIKMITKEDLDEIGDIDVVCGGFPCQPYSLAGKRKGKNDDRDLWPEMLRIIQLSRPTWVIGENVANFANMELRRSVTDLEKENYSVGCFIIPACAINAPHRRDRVWIIAHNNGERIKGKWENSLPLEQRLPSSKNVRRIKNRIDGSDLHTPKLCRSRNGISERLDAIGNAVNPQTVKILGQAIMGINLHTLQLTPTAQNTLKTSCSNALKGIA